MVALHISSDPGGEDCALAAHLTVPNPGLAATRTSPFRPALIELIEHFPLNDRVVRRWTQRMSSLATSALQAGENNLSKVDV
jgi:hypothetical protein